MTKLNRSHLIHGDNSYILPVSWAHGDRSAGEWPSSGIDRDSTGFFHGSRGFQKPASDQLLSEPAIVASLAKATLPANPTIDWDDWIADYSRIRDLQLKQPIQKTFGL